jgi:hypothetical protein
MQTPDEKTTYLSLNSLLHLLKFAKSQRPKDGSVKANDLFMQNLALLQQEKLATADREASSEWDSSEDANLWEKTIDDGL